MAGNSQIIDEVVSPVAEKQVNDLKAASAALNAEFAGLLKTTIELNSQIGKVANNSKFAKAQEQAALAAERLAAAQLKTQQAAANAQFAIDRQAAAQAKLNQVNAKAASAEAERNRLAEKRRRIVQENTAAELAEANAVNTETAAIRANTQAVNQNLTSEIQAEQAAARYRAARLGTAVATTEETAALAANTAAQATNSNALANVGRGLTRGLGYLRTLAYVLPGIGIAGIFNLIYEGLVKVFSESQKFDKFIDNFKILNSLMMDAGAQSGAEIAKLDALFRALNNVNLPLKERNEAVKDLQDMYPEHLSNLTLDNSKTAELTKQYKALKEELISIAYVQAGYNKIAEVTGRIFDDEFRINEERVKNLQIRQKVNASQKAENELNASGARNRNANNDALDGGVRKTTQLAQAQGELAKSDKLITDAARDRAINQQRIDLIQKQIDDRVKKSGVGILGGKQDKVKKVKDTSAEDELKALEYQYNQQIELARAKDKENAELEKEYLKQIDNYRKEAFEKQKAEFEQTSYEQLEILQQETQLGLIDLEKRYASGKIKKEQYEYEKTQIEYKANRASLEAQLSAISQIIALEEATGKDTANEKKKLSELTRALAKGDADYEIAQLKSVAAARQELNKTVKQLVGEAANFITALVDAGFTNRKNALRKEQDEIESRTQAEIGAVDRSLSTEQQKADKIAVINAKSTAEKERIAREERKIDVEKAKFEKLASVARIIAATGVAEVQALTYLSNPFTAPLYPAIAAAIAGLGALQLATVLATPIPQYAKGTKSAKGGLSIVGERGRELVETPSGMSFLTADTAQMINLPKGSKVTPHHETMRMIGRPENLSKYSGGEVVPWREVIDAIKQNKQEKTSVKNVIKVDAGFYQYRQNHFS